ncbi:MAG: porin family protein [candidate division Zixibacteria bacterium]|nr:porin family protein [candidate division Zixibacteria bacterium]
MKKLSILLFGFIIICIGEDTRATDLTGKFALSGMGGISYLMGNGFSSEGKIKNNYGFGVSLEYFFLKELSGGLALVSNSFQGDWIKSSYHLRGCCYSTDWNWTSVSIFGKFVLDPETKISPYLKGGVGLYIPWIKDWWYYPPNTSYTHKSYGRGQFGWYFGVGIQYRLSKKMFLSLDIPLNVIYTDGLVIHWIDLPRMMERYHKIYEKSHYFNFFAGVSFLFGTKKK